MGDNLLTIADMARETGIAPDTLRVWERRYGFPSPMRNQQHERVYVQEELERLRLIKQLLDNGQRPGKLTRLTVHELQTSTQQLHAATSAPPEIEQLLETLAAEHLHELPAQLDALLKRQGLPKFLTDTVVPLNQAVGNAWFNGKIGILDEHRYSEQIRSILTLAFHNLPVNCHTFPRVLLTTLPAEQHTIGLLMVACLLRLKGAEVLMLGAQTPLDEIVRGAVTAQCQIVGLSCSAHQTRRTLASQLVRLRKLLPDTITIWAGGSGVCGIPPIPNGVHFFHDLHQVSPALLAIASKHQRASLKVPPTLAGGGVRGWGGLNAKT
jgi:DNA-binding transcriptional MerR regulator